MEKDYRNEQKKKWKIKAAYTHCGAIWLWMLQLK
jgi:hypothetical protein